MVNNFLNDNELIKIKDSYNKEKEKLNTLDNDKLSLSGGQLTGQVTTTQTTFNSDQQLITKKYVDDKIGDIETILASVVGEES